MSALPTSSASIWRQLTSCAERRAGQSITDLFLEDDTRASRFRIDHGDLHLDYAKTTLDDQALSLLQQLFDACQVEHAYHALAAGEPVNLTEQRPALHLAARAAALGKSAPQQPEFARTYQRAMNFASALRDGSHRGFDGQPIRDVVNIGIGGSDLGPRLVCSALGNDGPTRLHFVSSLDGAELEPLLTGLSPQTSAFLISSKSFGTEETLRNAADAIAWFKQRTGHTQLGQHFAAITGNAEQAIALGVDESLIFGVPSSIGGRYSIWSSTGIPAMIALGKAGFESFLAGACDMDEHARNPHLRNNMPALLAALELWHRNLHGLGSLAIVPYSYALRLLPAYLQQLVMESNGKSCERSGEPAERDTAGVVWGTAGTDGQHSYHQLLHQGTQAVPVDFILPLDASPRDRQQRLASHCLAQSKALMEGKSTAAAYEELMAQGVPEADARRLAPHKAMPGNRPSSTLLMNGLGPANLGALIALYEHKTFFTATIWNINPFDQWGVELGKQLSGQIFNTLAAEQAPAYDPATDALIHQIRRRAK